MDFHGANESIHQVPNRKQGNGVAAEGTSYMYGTRGKGGIPTTFSDPHNKCVRKPFKFHFLSLDPPKKNFPTFGWSFLLVVLICRGVRSLFYGMSLFCYLYFFRFLSVLFRSWLSPRHIWVAGKRTRVGLSYLSRRCRIWYSFFVWLYTVPLALHVCRSFTATEVE